MTQLEPAERSMKVAPRKRKAEKCVPPKFLLPNPDIKPTDGELCLIVMQEALIPQVYVWMAKENCFTADGLNVTWSEIQAWLRFAAVRELVPLALRNQIIARDRCLKGTVAVQRYRPLNGVK